MRIRGVGLFVRSMWIILAFWSLLPVPGLAWLYRFDPDSLQGGLLSIVARAYLASLVLLTPVSVLGYVLHWPVTVLSIAYLGSVAAGIWLLARARQRWRRPQLRDFSVIGVLGCCWLAFDLWLGARVGTHIQGDAGFHIARIRMLREIGLGSWDPLVEGLQFEPVYHTNLYHALIATSAQLAGVDPGAAWIWVWPFAKLIVAAASYELALQVFGERWLGWIGAITAGVWFATQSVLSYPNTLAPFGFFAFGLAMTLAVLSAPPSFRNAAWLGAAGAMIAQTHMLYASFLMLVALPSLLVRFGYAVVRRQRGRPELFAALLFLAAPLPWLAVPALPRIEALVTSVAHAQAPQLDAAVTTEKERKKSLFIDAGEGRLRMNPRDFLGVRMPVTHLLGALALFFAITRRGAVLAVLGILATMGLYLFVPALCSALIRLLTAPWVVVRFATVLDILCISLLPAAALAVLGVAAARLNERLGAVRLPVWVSGTLQLLGCASALGYAQLDAPRHEPWTIARTWDAAQLGSARVNAERITERAKFFAKHVAAGASVMAPLGLDYVLPMHCNCRGFAFRGGRGGRDVPDIDARRDAVTRFYARGTSAVERAEIAARYHLQYVYSSPRRAPRLAAELAPRVVATASAGSDAIIQLR